jgi:SAM-dependent methyltransferase
MASVVSEKEEAPRILGPEAQKGHDARRRSGFYAHFLSGPAVLDIGFRGGHPRAEPITANAIGVELDYPGYDGRTLPFPAESQDAVFSSHCLEHIDDYRQALSEWYRVLKIGGYLIIAVPHQYLYERKPTLPSIFNPDHKRLYTPQSLLREIEDSIPIDGYRLRSLRDNDEDFDYTIAPSEHARGMYEIELVLQKIARPVYGPQIGWRKIADLTADRIAAVCAEMMRCEDEGRTADRERLNQILVHSILPPFISIRSRLPNAPLERLRGLISSHIERVPFSARWYLRKYPDLTLNGTVTAAAAHAHFLLHGYFEGRQGSEEDTCFGG